MSTKLERLLFSRKRLSADISLQITAITAFVNETPQTVILARKEALEDLWEEYKANTELIEKSNAWVGTDDFIQENSQRHEAYVNALVHILTLMPEENETLQNSMRSARNPRHRSTTYADIRDDSSEYDGDISATRLDTSGASNESMNEGLPISVKLPPLQINTFSGDKIEWPEFKITCESTFAELRNKTHRFKCLKSYLSGEPHRMVRHLHANEHSYDEAWSILSKRYDDERAIINAHLQKFIDLPFLVTETSEDLKLMLNTTNECIAALKSFKIATDSWDSILIFLLSQRLDATSIKHWEEKIQGSKIVPKLSTFLEYLEIRINILEITSSQRKVLPVDNSASRKQKVLINNTVTPKKCTICQEDHFAYVCAQLLSKPDNEKFSFIEGKGLCTNCFHAHKVADCTSRFSCKICNSRHNSVLHAAARVFTIITEESQVDGPIEPEEEQAMEMAQCHSVQTRKRGLVILATALVKVEFQNRCMLVKALIDQGSTTNLIPKNVCRTLDLHETNTAVPITGVCGQVSYNVTKQTLFTVRSLTNDKYTINVNALVVPRITTLNSASIKTEWNHLHGLQLADPQMHGTNRIDLLLGASTFTRIICDGLIKGKIGQPMAQSTELSWIISGDSEEPELHQQIVPVFTIIAGELDNEILSANLRRFWEIEEIPRKKLLTVEEEQAETHYSVNTKRCLDGRYMVKLPFKVESSKEIGSSFPIAKRRFNNMVKRFSSKPEFRAKYDQCIREYLDLNHMKLLDTTKQTPKYYLPHHPVIKESSSTTKIRPVFDASCRTLDGKSLNSELLIGPTIQPDLFSLMTKWRKFKFAITGDIEKMYRQIWVDPNDAMYQCILWQPDSLSELKSYSLKTVTFGVASAPFLAIRTLYQIGDEIKDKQPILAEKIQTNFYVDDYFDSAETSGEARSIIEKITLTLADYGFQLRKWKSNNVNVTMGLRESEMDKSPCNTFKTLGVQWHSESDNFVFVPHNLSTRDDWTKRTVLSEVCKLFDPLGWLSPCIIFAKIFIQKLWLIQLGWDEKLSGEITNEWKNIQIQFTSTCSVKIPRWIGLSSCLKHVSLQGFADASEKAYGCVAYLRIEHENGSISSEILAAKTRVAKKRCQFHDLSLTLLYYFRN